MERPNTGAEPYTAPGYTAVTYSNSGTATANFYVTLKNPNEYENVMNQIKSTMEAETESEIKSTAPKRRLLGNRSHACTGLKKYLKGFAPHSSSPRHTACRRTALLQAACQLIYKLSFNQLRNMSAEQKLPRLLFFLSLHRRQSVGTRLNLA